MKRLLTSLAVAALIGVLAAPQIDARDNNRGGGRPTSSGGSRGASNNAGGRPANNNGGGGRQSSNGGGRPAGSTNSRNPGGSDYRPNNPGQQPGVNPGGNHNGGQRPGNDNNGYRPNNPGGQQPGVAPGGNNGNHNGGNHNGGQRPGNDNNGYRPNNPGGQRPAQPGPGAQGYRPYQPEPNHGHGHGYEPGPRPGTPGLRPNPGTPPPPYRPNWGAPWAPPRPPMGWRPGPRVPGFSTILGITFGTTLNLSLNYLLNSGYTVYSYGSNVVYLSNVNQLNLFWPDAQLYYGPAGLSRGEFIYDTPYYSTSRYNTAYNSLIASYGAPVSVAYPANGMEATWFGNDGRFVTLRYQPAYGVDGVLRYYTTLSFGF